MNAHLAHESKRAYVFQDYVWKRDYYSWPESQFRQDPPRTPLNALIAGPTAGGPWEADDESPRAVSEEWFDIVCPPHERRIINTRDVKPAVRDSPGDKVFAHWAKLLGKAPERCVEITADPEDLVKSWTAERKHEAGERRLMDIMSWTWKPDAGQMRDWDAEEFVVRLLRSPGGLIFIGGAHLPRLLITSPHHTFIICI